MSVYHQCNDHIHFNRVKEDGTVVIDGGSPLVVADDSGSEPRVFNTFGELEQADRVSPPPQGIVITGSITHSKA